MQPTVCVEIGYVHDDQSNGRSGSGVVSTFLSQLLHPIKVISLATDINEYACSASLRTAAINKVDLELVRCNLLDPYMQRLGGKIDVLVFNPPYVPTSTQEQVPTQNQLMAEFKRRKLAKISVAPGRAARREWTSQRMSWTWYMYDSLDKANPEPPHTHWPILPHRCRAK